MSARAIRQMAAACGMLLLVAACGGSSSGSSGSASPSAGAPTNGGTLKLLGSGDVDHLDPASAHYTVSYTLERAFTRQLVSYPASSSIGVATTVEPDLASTLPTTANGGISSDGKTYTFHLRSGPQWNTSPPRAVTAADVVRGMQRICNPASPCGGLSYYEDTIAGFTSFCNGFAKVNASSATAMAKYMNSNAVSGIKAPNASTVVITLTKPASDFLNIMALPFASAAPSSTSSTCPTVQPSGSTRCPTAPMRSRPVQRAAR
jgi:peptide/nickel transport system substrate-binding protein